MFAPNKFEEVRGGIIDGNDQQEKCEKLMAKHHKRSELVGRRAAAAAAVAVKETVGWLRKCRTKREEGYVYRLVLVGGIFGGELKPSRTPVRVADYKLDVAKSSVSRPVDRRRG